MVRFQTLKLAAMLACISIIAGCERPIASPTQNEDETIVFSETDENSDYALKAGDSFIIRLESIPTAGYSWLPFKVPPCISLQENATGFEPTQPDLQNQPGFTGGNHYIVLHFEASTACKGTLELVEARQWELYNDDGSIKDRSAITDRYRLHLSIDP